MYSSTLPAKVSRTAARSMNAPLLPEVLLGVQAVDQRALQLATAGIQRFVWQSAYGPILIEVRDGASFVNGKRVLSMVEMREADSRPEAARRNGAAERAP